MSNLKIMKTINFYFDFLSPYSYFAWMNHRVAFKDKIERGEVLFNYKPVLMGKLFSHFEFKGPGEIPVKRSYELKNCFRYAAANQIAFKPPATHPFNPMAVIRLATSSANSSSQKQFEVIDLLFKAVWQKGLVLEDPDVIDQIVKESSICDEVFEKSFTKDSKVELKTNIKEAISANIFGVPTFQLSDETFWGNDSITHLINHIDGKEKWDKEFYNSLINND